MKPGDKVRLKANPGKIGILGNETDGPAHRRRLLVQFLDGDEQFILEASLEKVERELPGPFAMISRGRFGRVIDLRGAITYYRLTGKLANLIYSLNTTNTQFFAYQFKPVLHFLDSPCRGILIADEVGLGKTIEAGLIWTELRARLDARRLLIICPAMLREKWQFELADRFGVKAEIVDAAGLLKQLQTAKDRFQDGFAVITSMQGIRPSRDWDDDENPGKSESAKLARFLRDAELDDSLLDLAVIDEAHYLRNRDTQTHRLGQLVRPIAENLVMLSATPIQLRNTDLFHLLNLLDEDAFPYASSFSETLEANAPIVRLRDRVLASTISRDDFVEELRDAVEVRIFEDNLQIEYLIENPPSDEVLASPRGRSEVADYLDKLNPLAKVVTRTRKRDVHEMRVVRDPFAIKVTMNPEEAEFYQAVTDKVRQFCENMQISTGFMLTIPQRQMSSCMAAACRGWLAKLGKLSNGEFEETRFEAFGDEDFAVEETPTLGTLLTELVAIARKVGDYEALRRCDSKYKALKENLQGYWKNYPDKKVVLFSFYRNSLDYLKERLLEDGIASVLVYGGMDKQEALRRFAEPNGPNILLSSEVASEGVDLQFSSLLINYDLPWNPMRIEQRIGRIDRIGQEAEKILIWNFLYANTVDDRVYDRLLERLDIFKRAMGSIESILGEQIRDLSYYLLTHALSPEQEQQRIDLAKVAIETVSRDQERLEEEATQLIAHGDYIQNKVSAARELGRYVRGEDLFAFIKDFFDRTFEGSRFVASPEDSRKYELELSVDARVRFGTFLQEQRLQGRTALLSSRPMPLLFENRVGTGQRGIERVSQDHPLVRFVSEQIKNSATGPGYFPVSAVQLPVHAAGFLSHGHYAYAISRWTLSGSRDLERLEYAAKNIESGAFLGGEDAERLINLAAMEGKDWLGTANWVDISQLADAFEDCKSFLEDAFVGFREAYRREDKDRISLMVNTLERHRKAQRDKVVERITRYRSVGNERQRRMIPAEEGRLKKQDSRLNEKIEALRLREQLSASESFVSGGVIRIE